MSAGSGLTLGLDADNPRVRFQGLTTPLGRDYSLKTLRPDKATIRETFSLSRDCPTGVAFRWGAP
jgi:hypothetical protein